MKILHITSEYPPIIWGGLGTAVGGLTTALASENDSVCVLLVGGCLVLDKYQYGGLTNSPNYCLLNKFTTQDSPNENKIHFLHIAPDQAFNCSSLFSGFWKPDIIHFHSGWLLAVAEQLREKFHSPLIFTVHSIDRAEYEMGKFFNHWEVQEHAINSADSIIAISENEKELLSEYYPHIVNKVSIVGNGIADSKFAQSITQSREWKKKELTVLYTGRFVERKGIKELFEAIPKVLNQFQDVRFVLVGGYGGGAEIEKEWLADGLKEYKDKIIFTGWLTPEQVNQWYEGSDMLVIPSWYEPFGMVVLEGMLYGLPIVATNVGGPAEILDHNKTALLIPPKDSDALANSILSLLRDASLRKKLGECSAEEVRNKWLWDKVVKKIRKAYSDALAVYKTTHYSYSFNY